MCKLTQVCTSASRFGNRRYVSFSQSLTQGLGKINFNVQYVVIIELQSACLVIVHWCSMSTHWGRDKMADISLTTFQMHVFPKGPINNFQHWFRLWLMAGHVTSHYLNQWSPRLVTHGCVTRPQSVNKTVWLYMWNKDHKAKYVNGYL